MLAGRGQHNRQILHLTAGMYTHVATAQRADAHVISIEIDIPHGRHITYAASESANAMQPISNKLRRRCREHITPCANRHIATVRGKLPGHQERQVVHREVARSGGFSSGVKSTGGSRKFEVASGRYSDGAGTGTHLSAVADNDIAIAVGRGKKFGTGEVGTAHQAVRP